MSDELQIITPPETTVMFMGEEVKVTPVRMGNLQDFTTAVRPIAGDLMEAFNGSGDMITTIELHTDRMILAVHFGTGVPVEKLKAAMPDEFLALTAAVVEINMDFFVRRLLPSIKTTLDAMKSRLKAGQESYKA